MLDTNSFKSDYEILLNRDAKVSGIVVWFETQLSPSVLLTTSPFHDPTHWHQTFLAFKEDQDCSMDDTIKGEIAISPQQRNHRAIKILL